MKTLLSIAALTASLAVAAPVAVAEPETYVIDDEHFSMSFEVNHIGYAPVMGMFRTPAL
ncbi:hypothetical protein [Marinobacter sp.]|uniref:hypothetical protein n=1 Tax=Marinobacter sp. TaxID=50741 RepID=UPI003B520D58|tara:strand:+ start:797 stop:973 length:177 start_codon:yes stop_codon:yes gene_type:complete